MAVMETEAAVAAEALAVGDGNREAAFVVKEQVQRSRLQQQWQ